MQAVNNKTRFSGNIPPLMTPLATCERIDEEAYEAMIRHVIRGGASGAFAMSSSGESLHNTRAVWEQGQRIALRFAKEDFQIINCASCASTAQAIDNIHFLEDIGAKTVAVTAPFYTHALMQSEILRHYETILAKTSADICLYNIPGLIGGLNIAVETAAALADHERVVMFKQSSPDWEQQQRTIFALRDKDIAVFSGGEAFCTSAALYGASGNISGFATAFPRLFTQAYEAARRHEMEEALRLQETIFALVDLMNMNASAFSIMKYALVAVGIGKDTNAYHTEPLTAGQKERIEAMAARLGSMGF